MFYDLFMKIIKTVMLDISYTPSREHTNMINYRLSVNTMPQIKKMLRMFHLRKNHVVYTGILAKMLKGEPNIELMKKIKNHDNIIDIHEWRLRFRLADELDVNKKEQLELTKLSFDSMDKISFRLKERISLIVIDNSDVKIQIDLTKVKSFQRIKSMEYVTPSYELEVELTPKKSVKNTQLTEMIKYIGLLMKVNQSSNHIISMVEKPRVCIPALGPEFWKTYVCSTYFKYTESEDNTQKYKSYELQIWGRYMLQNV